MPVRLTLSSWGQSSSSYSSRAIPNLASTSLSRSTSKWLSLLKGTTPKFRRISHSRSTWLVKYWRLPTSIMMLFLSRLLRKLTITKKQRKEKLSKLNFASNCIKGPTQENPQSPYSTSVLWAKLIAFESIWPDFLTYPTQIANRWNVSARLWVKELTSVPAQQSTANESRTHILLL